MKKVQEWSACPFAVGSNEKTVALPVASDEKAWIMYGCSHPNIVAAGNGDHAESVMLTEGGDFAPRNVRVLYHTNGKPVAGYDVEMCKACGFHPDSSKKPYKPNSFSFL
jgi:hypothetical protein